VISRHAAPSDAYQQLADNLIRNWHQAGIFSTAAKLSVVGVLQTRSEGRSHSRCWTTELTAV
jgi:hypothetical protein